MSVDFSSVLRQEDSLSLFSLLEHDDPFVSGGAVLTKGEMCDFDAFVADLPSPTGIDISLFDHLNSLSPSPEPIQDHHHHQLQLLQSQELSRADLQPMKPVRRLTMSAKDTKDMMEMLQQPAGRSRHMPRTNAGNNSAVVAAARPPTQLLLSPTPSEYSSSPSPGPVRVGRGRPSKVTSLSKQAQYAREYRQKNKEHIDTLQAEVNTLVTENRELKQDKAQMNKSIIDLRAEVQYLRNVLANESSLAPLLANVTNNNGMKLQFPLKKGALEQQKSGGAGVCIHVVDDSVSVELCGRCNRQARSEKRIVFPRISLDRLASRHRISEMVIRLGKMAEPAGVDVAVEPINGR
uniref:BZIP domain-containing protein n=1 Tax=Plectus sambesii TaxID=2011161 RepID=A0A914WG03_9BILA